MKNKNIEESLREAFLELDFNDPKNAEMLTAFSNATLKPSFWGITFNLLSSTKGVIGLISLSLFVGLLIYNNSEDAEYQTKNWAVHIQPFEWPIETLPKIETVSMARIPYAEPTPKPVKQKLRAYVSPDTVVEVKARKKIFRPETQAVMPDLTQGEIEEHYKRKKILIANVLKLHRNKFSKITGTASMVNYKGQPIENFAMWSGEVTNIDYTTFLNDLIIEKRKKEYLKAKIYNEGWMELSDSAFLEPMKELYAKHPAYHLYPVVNISRAGAELFCDWLTDEIANSDKNKENLLEVRIPTNREWEYAASYAWKYDTYPWGGPYVRHVNGNYLANFYPEKGNYVVDGALFTAKTSSYFPNDFGLYNLSGNVAEMVVYPNDSIQIGTRGGSWKDVVKYIQIYADDPYRGVVEPQPTIGFRPIITYKKIDEKAETSFDRNARIKLTQEQIIENNARKNQMILKVMTLDKKVYVTAKAIPNSKSSEDRMIEEFEMSFMAKCEVSNIEYKTFLLDLIVQNRIEEFHQFVPDEKQWIALGNHFDVFEKLYFSDEAYENYPVVNVSVEGAEAYTNWLMSSSNFTATKGNLRGELSLKLPTKKEWEFAASAGGLHKIYPWEGEGYKSVKRRTKGQALANFKMSREEIRENYKIIAENNADVIAPVASYWPNAMGFYNMAGNVAEMVKYEDGEYGSKGGSWNNTADAIKIYSSDASKGQLKPSPYVGFRISGKVKFKKGNLVGTKGVMDN